MRTLIDFTQIPIQKVGVGVYAKETFSRLIRIKTDSHFFVLLQSDDKELAALFKESNVKILKVYSPFSRLFFIRFLIEQFYIPIICLFYKIDLLHSLHYSFPLFTSKHLKKVVTIHDLTFFIYPHLHTIVKRYYFRFFTRLACKYADSIICVSNSTKSDLFRYVKQINAQINVIPLAANLPVVEQKMIRAVKEKFRVQDKYLLFIGTLEPRKNITNLIKAYANNYVVNNEYQLVVVGKKGWYYREIFDLLNQLKLGDKVVLTGFVSPAEKFALLSSCALFVYPSIYEGFGLPVLEALGYGLPVITSNVSSLPEVVGKAAILINPFCVDELTRAIELCLFDREICETLKETAVKQFEKFSWEKTALKTECVYSNLNN